MNCAKLKLHICSCQMIFTLLEKKNINITPESRISSFTSNIAYNHTPIFFL